MLQTQFTTTFHPIHLFSLPPLQPASTAAPLQTSLAHPLPPFPSSSPPPPLWNDHRPIFCCVRLRFWPSTTIPFNAFLFGPPHASPSALPSLSFPFPSVSSPFLWLLSPLFLLLWLILGLWLGQGCTGHWRRFCGGSYGL